MSRLSLKKDFKDGTILYGEQMNTNNKATELAVNDNFDKIQNLQTLKADVSDVTAKLTTKVDNTTFNDAINSLNTTKANVSLVNTKADKTEVALKADKTELQIGLSLKADKTYVDEQVSKKANTTYVDAQLKLKTDKTTVGDLSKLISGIDNSSIVNAINSVQKEKLPIATTTTVGAVKPDGITTTIDADGTLHSIGGGGTGGTTDYDGLTNRPRVNGVLLTGNKTSKELDLVGSAEFEEQLKLKSDKANTYTKEETETAITKGVASKADKAYVDTQLTAKANVRDVYSKEESDAIIDGIESTFTSALATKADSTIVGDLSNLETNEKTSVVLAINEVNANANKKSDLEYVDNQLKLKSDKADTYTKEEVNNLVDNQTVAGDTLPIGSVSAYAGISTPENWLLCDGREVSRNSYSQLFNVIGTTYGDGDGSSTFNLPNISFAGTETKNYIIKAKQSSGVVAAVVDSLESSSTIDALSANQGKVLANKGLKKLWENSNSNNIFNAQTISLSSDDYDYLIWFYIDVNGTSSNRYMMSTNSLKGWGVNIFYPFDGQVPGTANYYNTNWKRSITHISDTSFKVEDCIGKRGNETSATTNNIYCIPLAIYGGKF